MGNHPKSGTNENTVSSYSNRGSTVYDDPLNKNFLYGEITIRFLKQIPFRLEDRQILDIGCGTGFVFDVLYDTFRKNGMHGIGIEPAQGMLDQAISKLGNNPLFEFHSGSFENIPLPDQSVDRIISTLALHWVESLEVAAREMRRVLKNSGRLDIFMIERDDGAEFKKSIVNTQRKHLTFEQIMKTATLVQRVTGKKLNATFEPHFKGFDIQVENHRDVVYGSFEDHMKWWKARSSPVISEVKDKERFIEDLRDELKKNRDKKGIPFPNVSFFS